MLEAYEFIQGEMMSEIMRGRDFVVFSDDWGRHPFSCQHIMQHFIPHNRVLWVNTIGMRLPRLTVYDIRRALGKLKDWTSAPAQDSLPEGLHVISPFMIPFNPIKAVRSFNRRNVVSCVKNAMRELGINNPVFLATVPNAADYVGHFDESLIIYYCVDDFTVWPGMDLPGMVKEMERSLVNRSDLVIAVSDELCVSRQPSKGRAHLLTHGVDLTHFRGVAVDRSDIQSFSGITGPIIGFYGLIDSHLDIEIVRALLDFRDDWTVVLIGTKRISLEVLEARKNFRWIPAVPYSELPQYASTFDVAIIPYKVNQHTNTANPLKLKEYLALGKPIVTTPMNEVIRYGEHLRIARDSSEFVTAVVSALSDDVRPEDRLACLSSETWEAKAIQVSTWIDEELAKKTAPQKAVTPLKQGSSALLTM